jgi:hypothetical protein
VCVTWEFANKFQMYKIMFCSIIDNSAICFCEHLIIFLRMFICIIIIIISLFITGVAQQQQNIQQYGHHLPQQQTRGKSYDATTALRVNDLQVFICFVIFTIYLYFTEHPTSITIACTTIVGKCKLFLWEILI